MASRDPAHKYVTQVEGRKNVFKCSFCDFIITGGGITRAKYHLTGLDPKHNVKKCPAVPPEVQAEIRSVLKEKEVKKATRNRVEQQIQAELSGRAGKGIAIGTASGQDDEDEDDEETEYNRALQMTMTQSRHEYNAANWGRSQSTREPPAAPSLYMSDIHQQPRIPEVVGKKKGGRWKNLATFIAKHFIHDNVPAFKVGSHHFKNMISAAQEAGPGIKVPNRNQIYGQFLDAEYEELMERVTRMRNIWATNGCTLMADGWTGPTRLSIINFMVYSNGKTVFWKSIDASNKIKDSSYIFRKLDKVIQEIGRENVVQIVTDNGSAYKKAGQDLMAKYNLYWTPCAAHCLDLMFEDIGKRDSVSRTILESRRITTHIYNHGTLLAKVREACEGDLVRPGATRFASNYLALKSILGKK